ncbi:unnamed protein product, partial [Rotaria sp. Silwood1]
KKSPMANSLNKTHRCIEILNAHPTAKYQVFIFRGADNPDSKTQEVYDFSPFIGDELLCSTLLSIPIIVFGGEYEDNVKEPFLNWLFLVSLINK